VIAPSLDTVPDNWRRRYAAISNVIISHVDPAEAEYGDMMIYPSPLKVTEMNGYPDSEMVPASFIRHPRSPALS
jgi:hypothetical protein